MSISATSSLVRVRVRVGVGVRVRVRVRVGVRGTGRVRVGVRGTGRVRVRVGFRVRRIRPTSSGLPLSVCSVLSRYLPGWG